jgi:sugar phosphate isomerase/epimerase
MVATPDIISRRALGYHGDLEASVNLLRALAYDGIEPTMANPDVLDRDWVYEVLRRSGLDVPLICTGEVWGQEGLGLVDPDPETRTRALDRIRAIIRFAAPLGAAVNIGRSRGRYVEGVPAEKTEQWAEEAFRALADYAQDLGVTIVLEPIAAHVCNLINSTQDGIEWVRRVDRPNFRLMLDVYHMNIEDATPIEESIEAAAPYITYVHLCETNRKPPGWGHMDFAKVISALRAAGYDGYVSAEVFNFPTQEEAIRQSAAVLRPLVSAG